VAATPLPPLASAVIAVVTTVVARQYWCAGSTKTCASRAA
jgi:hypothetical protein